MTNIKNLLVITHEFDGASYSAYPVPSDSPLLTAETVHCDDEDQEELNNLLNSFGINDEMDLPVEIHAVVIHHIY